MPVDEIQYSGKYTDDQYEYRHVILPHDLVPRVPKSHLMTETEWRNIGVQQSPDWVHYMMHSPEPHVLLFRRPRSSTHSEANHAVQNVNGSLMLWYKETEHLKNLRFVKVVVLL